ncbi:MAG: RNA polymerase sigma-70 factor [Bacteroidota bacterium]
MDKRAIFDNYFDDNYRPLCAFAYRFINDSEVVEDLVQEVFISFWEKLESVAEPAATKSYLYTSTRNKCLNHLKHLAVEQKHQSQIQYEIESDQVFQSQVIEEEVFNQLYTEIRDLPEAAKKIILLALKGLKNHEIAAELNISENTVKTQKKLSYAKLRQNISLSALTFLLGF